jgi:hypothetical protein
VTGQPEAAKEVGVVAGRLGTMCDAAEDRPHFTARTEISNPASKQENAHRRRFPPISVVGPQTPPASSVEPTKPMAVSQRPVLRSLDNHQRLSLVFRPEANRDVVDVM